MVVWAVTAGIGVCLLAAVIAGYRQPDAAPPANGTPADTALLEFSHPALALTGLTFWIFFVVTSVRVFAWIALGVVAATIAAGLAWAVTGWRRARATSAPGESGLPLRLMLIHGLAAACTLALVVIGAVAARG